ncbi:MAG: cupin domain-containing protein [Lachnospiraceae bacterium]|nr:cupin domain-containing protein [Lachnospiraceae bacterium]
MIRKQENIRTTTKTSPFSGTGNITVRDILESPEEMYQKGRVFCHTTVYAGSGIGYHVHQGESETYYILSGHGTFNDNGVMSEIGPGDVLFTGDQAGHSIEATKGEDIEMIALILYK